MGACPPACRPPALVLEEVGRLAGYLGARCGRERVEAQVDSRRMVTERCRHLVPQVAAGSQPF